MNNWAADMHTNIEQLTAVFGTTKVKRLMAIWYKHTETEPVEASKNHSNEQAKNSDRKNSAQKQQTNKSSSGQDRPTPPKKPIQVSTAQGQGKPLTATRPQTNKISSVQGSSNSNKPKNQQQKPVPSLNNNKDRLPPLRQQLPSGVANPKLGQVSIPVENLVTPPPLPAKKSRQTATAHSNTKNPDVKNTVQKPQTNKISSVQAKPPLLVKKPVQGPELPPRNKPVQASTTRSNTKNPGVENPAQKLQASKVSSAQAPELPPRNPGFFADKINKDTYLSLQLNMDYLSADISALYTTDSGSRNDLLKPIKEALKQLASANLEQKLKELEKIKACLTNLPVNLSNLELRDKLLEDTQDTNEKPNEELKYAISCLRDSSIPLSKINRIKQSLKQLLSAQDHAISQNKSNDIIKLLDGFSIISYTSDLIKNTLKQLQSPEAKISELLKELNSNLKKSSDLTLKLIKESKNTLCVTLDSKATQNEEKKLIIFATDYLVTVNISRFLNDILEKNTPQIQINEGIYSSINLTIDSFKHILSKIALSLGNGKQEYRDTYKKKSLAHLKSLIKEMWQLNQFLAQEKNSDYANVVKELIVYANDLIKNEKQTDPLLNIEISLSALDKEKKPNLYLKINQYYFFLKSIRLQSELINNTENFKDSLSSYSTSLPLTAILLGKVKILTDLLTTNNSPLKKFNNIIFEKFGSILTNMQALLYERSMSNTSLEASTAFLHQLASVTSEIYQQKYFLENPDKVFFDAVSDCYHAITFSKQHLAHIIAIEEKISSNEEKMATTFSNQYRSLKYRMQLTNSNIGNALPLDEPLLILLKNEMDTLSELDLIKGREKTTYTQSLIRLDIILDSLQEKIHAAKGCLSLIDEIIKLRILISTHKNSCFNRNEKIIYDFELIEKDSSLLQKAYQTLTNFYKASKTSAPFILKNISDLKKLNSTKSIKTTLSNHYLLVSKTIIKKKIDSKTFEKLKTDKKSSNVNTTTVKKLLASQLPPMYELIALKLNYLLSHNRIIEIPKNDPTQKDQKLESFALGFNKIFLQKIIELEPLFESVISKKTPNIAEHQFTADFLALATNIFDPLYSKPLSGRNHLEEMKNHLNQLHRSILYITTSINKLPDEHFYKKNKKLKLSGTSINDLNLKITTSINDLLPLVNISKIQISNLLVECDKGLIDSSHDANKPQHTEKSNNKSSFFSSLCLSNLDIPQKFSSPKRPKCG